MLRFLFEVFMCILAVFGAISLAVCVASSLRQRAREENSNVRMVLMVKNQEETIEGIIRNIFAGDFLRKVLSSRKLIVVDMGSTDQTLDMLMKLKKSYEYMDVLKEEEKEKLLSSLEEG